MVKRVFLVVGVFLVNLKRISIGDVKRVFLNLVEGFFETRGRRRVFIEVVKELFLDLV